MPAAAYTSPPTFQAKEPFERSWYIADVERADARPRRTKIADVLRGKHRPTFTPHVDAGDFVVVVNADKIKLTGKKWTGKLYRDHSLFPGGLRTQTAEQLIKRHPTDLVEARGVGHAAQGPARPPIYKKLKVYAGEEHPHAAQQPEPLKLQLEAMPDVSKSILRHRPPQARGGARLAAAGHGQDRHQHAARSRSTSAARRRAWCSGSRSS